MRLWFEFFTNIDFLNFRFVEMFTQFTTHEELEEFKMKIIVLIQESAPQILTLSELCCRFKAKYNVDFKKWFQHAKKGVPKAQTLFANYLRDVCELDFKTKVPEILVRGKGRFKVKRTAFEEQVKSHSLKECERNLKDTMKGARKKLGSSSMNPIQVEEDSIMLADGVENDYHEFFELDYKEEKFSSFQEFKALKTDVSEFKMYRDYQMIHIAYVKLRIVSIFHSNATTKLHYHTICALFRQFYNESFFQTPILKQFITTTEDRNANILQFLKRFCVDFLFINEKDEVSVCSSLASLSGKFSNELIKGVEKMKDPTQVGRVPKYQPPSKQPASQFLMGKVMSDNIPVDVRRSTEYHRYGNNPGSSAGTVGNNLLDFPGLSNPNYPVQHPNISQVNDKVNEIRNRMCYENRSVNLAELTLEVCKYFNVTSLHDLRPIHYREIRREIDIPAMQDLIKLQGKVSVILSLLHIP